jgi:hypothetical protein
MSETVDTSELFAQRHTSLRVGEIARTLSSHTPNAGELDGRYPADIAIGIPHRTWQLESFSKPIQDALKLAHNEIKRAFDKLISARTQVTHGMSSAHMPILSQEEISKLQKVIQTQSDSIAKLTIDPEAAKVLNLDSTMSAMRVLSEELKIANQLNTDPKTVVDLDNRAQAYRRIYEIGQYQGQLTNERDTTLIERGETPPKGANRHSALPEHMEAERKHYAHPLNKEGQVSPRVLPYNSTDHNSTHRQISSFEMHIRAQETKKVLASTIQLSDGDHRIMINSAPADGQKPLALQTHTDTAPHNTPIPAQHLPHKPHAPRAPGVIAGGAMAATAGVAAAATGATPAQAARVAGETLFSSILGVGGLLATNRDEAAVRNWVDAAALAGTTAGAVAGAIIGTPVPVVGNAVGAGAVGIIGNQIAAIGADEYYRLKARHFEGKKDTVAPSMGEQLFMAALNRSIEKSIPANIMQTDVRFRTSQENTLKDAGLGEKDKDGRAAADYLRDPKTRDAYLGALKDSLAKETNPKAREQIAHMVEASEKFVEMEGRRVAKLQPHMKEIENKLAVTLKVQHLAEKFKEENPTPTLAAASSTTAPTAPRTNGTSASRG